MAKRHQEEDPEYYDESEEVSDGKDAKKPRKSPGQAYWFMITVGCNKEWSNDDITKFNGVGPVSSELLTIKMGLDLEHWTCVQEKTWRQSNILLDSLSHECMQCKDTLWDCFPDGTWYNGSPDMINFWKKAEKGGSPAASEEDKNAWEMLQHLGIANFWNLHYHFVIHLKNKRTKNTITELFRDAFDKLFPVNKAYIHVGAVSTTGQAEARKYIYKKGDTYVAGPWNNKKDAPPEEGDLKISDLPTKVLPWHKLIINQLKDWPGTDTCRMIQVFEDAAGNNMKSILMKQLMMRYPEQVGIIKGACDAKDLQTKVMTQVKESGNKRMWIIDVPRTNSTKAKMEALNTEIENIKDGFYQQDKYKSEAKLKRQPWVWVFCNTNSGIGKTTDEDGNEVHKWSVDRGHWWEYNPETGDFTEHSYALWEEAKERALERLAKHQELMVDCEWPVLERSQSDK